MRQIFRVALLWVTAASFFALSALARAQDSPPLGDAARLARQQKQQKEAQAKAQGKNKDKDKDSDGDASAAKPKVITNDEIPGHAPSALPHNPDHQARPVAYSPDPAGGWKLTADQWKAQILSVKGYIASLQGNIDRLNDSVHYAPANCVSNCVQWNEHQQQKQQQVEQMKSQLEDMQKRLDDLQDAARQQGYGSAVYDP